MSQTKLDNHIGCMLEFILVLFDKFCFMSDRFLETRIGVREHKTADGRKAGSGDGPKVTWRSGKPITARCDATTVTGRQSPPYPTAKSTAAFPVPRTSLSAPEMFVHGILSSRYSSLSTGSWFPPLLDSRGGMFSRAATALLLNQSERRDA
jgi:hypothetical protein